MVLYPNRNVDTGDIKHYREFFTSGRVRRIYLDELGEAASLPIGIATAKLVIATDDIAIAKARELIDRTKFSTKTAAIITIYRDYFGLQVSCNE
ncbi:MAG: DUF2887 domain-containing protein [Nostoc sp.]